MPDLILVSFVPGIDTDILLQSQQCKQPEENNDTIKEEKPKRQRARIAGRFVADNPATPDVDEAYEEQPVELSAAEEDREN